jgi:hypothetical protein
MNKFRALFMVGFVAAAAAVTVLAAGSVGNPRPGYPHDTIIVHVMKADSGPKECDGGHSLFLRHTAGVIPPTEVYITMIDWVQLDNDGDGVADEDPKDGIDNDLDEKLDEDPVEPGATTAALDCDAYEDGVVKLQIRDTDPRAAWVSTQEWFMRAVGKPGQNFAFTSNASQTVSCAWVDADGFSENGAETMQCTSGEWFQLASFNLGSDGCVKTVKTGGKGGGKTPFCNVTDGFMVDVDFDGDGIVDPEDADPQFVFSVSCVDNPATLDVYEPDYCPLSSIIWDVDEEETTSQAKAQIFVGHTGAARVQTGKLR